MASKAALEKITNFVLTLKNNTRSEVGKIGTSENQALSKIVGNIKPVSSTSIFLLDKQDGSDRDGGRKHDTTVNLNAE